MLTIPELCPFFIRGRKDNFLVCLMVSYFRFSRRVFLMKSISGHERRLHYVFITTRS